MPDWIILRLSVRLRMRKLDENANDASKRSGRKRKRGGRDARVVRKARGAWTTKTDSMFKTVS